MSEHHPGALTPVQHPAELQPNNPTGTAAVLYEALRATAQHAAQARSYVSSVTHVTVHLPVDVVALALGRHRVTIWRAAKKLRALGLIDARPHKTTATVWKKLEDPEEDPDKGMVEVEGTVNDGTLWCVRLNPDEGTPAKLTHEELKHKWRNLDRDRRRRRTAHRAVQERMQQSKELPECGYDLELLLAWALPPRHSETPLSMTVAPARGRLEAVLDVRFADREDRAAAVATGAQALAVGLRDPGGLNFYRWLLWQLVRLDQSAGEDERRWFAVYEQAKYTERSDVREGFARGSSGSSGGALFVNRLKRYDWYDELVRASGRVGVRPARASVAGPEVRR